MKNIGTKYYFAVVFGSIFFILSAVFSQTVQAEEITVSENGAGSANEVLTQQANTASITSTNSTDVTNTAEVHADTGNNQVSDTSSGSTTITTGDVSTQIGVETTANTSVVTPTCCSAKGTLTIISGNGSGSKNTTTSAAQNINTYSAKQIATVTNMVNGTANTGGNSANNNTGTVSINTGNVRVQMNVKSGPLNQSEVSFPLRTANANSVSIIGNGDDSQNTAWQSENSVTNVLIENVAEIVNHVVSYLNTGGNEADGNMGDVNIETGDIDFEATIENGPMNFTSVSSDCHCGEKPHEQPVPVTPVEKVTPQTPSSDSSSGSPGEVASITAGKVLPVTGINWLVLAIVGNVMMLFLGMILRLRSGNAPGSLQ